MSTNNKILKISFKRIFHEIEKKKKKGLNRMVIRIKGDYYSDYNNLDSLKEALISKGYHIKLMIFKNKFLIKISWDKMRNILAKNTIVDLPYISPIESSILPFNEKEILLYHLAKNNGSYNLTPYGTENEEEGEEGEQFEEQQNEDQDSHKENRKMKEHSPNKGTPTPNSTPRKTKKKK